MQNSADLKIQLSDLSLPNSLLLPDVQSVQNSPPPNTCVLAVTKPMGTKYDERGSDHTRAGAHRCPTGRAA